MLAGDLPGGRSDGDLVSPEGGAAVEATGCDVALVMPVYNEVECIADVLLGWASVLRDVGARFVIIVVNDGSTDGTRRILESLKEPWLETIHQDNAGHGPAVLRGYERAATLAPWVFQCDSDDEMNVADFPAAWLRREQFDGLFGIRERASRRLWLRNVISRASRAVIMMLFGQAVADVNVPFRLMRAEVLQSVLAHIPRQSFAPNVMISAAFSKWQLRVLNFPLRNKPRKTGRSLMREVRVLSGTARTLWQILAFRRSLPASRR